MSARQEDFLFAEHVLRRGFATEEQVEECLGLLERLRGEMQLDETLAGILLKKGYLAHAQASVIEGLIHGEQAGRAKNQIEGYQLQSRLGSGAMGSVYKAQHLKLNIPVALKVLRVELAKNRTQVERLKREAQLAARLSHPNIVRSIDVGESNGFNFIAMEYVDGAPVRTLLRKGRMREKEALRIIRDVARGLEHAHEEGVVHRDVKPGNIILTREGVVKLADFGLARGQEPSDLTLDNASIGTPQYLAPEQARRAQDANARSDLFSLGATLYHMVTGRPPFSGDSLGEIFQKVLFCDFDPPETVVDDLGIDTVYLIHRLMRAHPRERYQSATALLQDIARIEAGERIAPSDFRGDYQAFLRRRRNRRLTIGAAAIVAIAVSAMLTVWKVREIRHERELAAHCLRVNGVGKDEVEQIDSLALLEQKLREMESARAERECGEEAVRALNTRIERTKVDIEQLQRAVTLAAQAASDDADFRALDRQLAEIRAIQPGAQRRLGEIREGVHVASRRDAQARYEDIYRPLPTHQGSPQTDLARLRALSTDLKTRYLPLTDPWAREVIDDADALQRLAHGWADAEERNRAALEKAARDRHYADAHRWLDALRKQRRALLGEAAVAGVDDLFLRHYQEGDPVALRLESDENAEWDRVKEQVRTQLERGRPDLARSEHLEPFLRRAYHTREEVDKRLRGVEGVHDQVVARQEREIRTRESLFEAALRDRQYARGWALVNEVADTVWIGDARESYARLLQRAVAMRGVLEEFLARAPEFGSVEVHFPLEEAGDTRVEKLLVPGGAIRLVEGADDPDLMLVEVNGKERIFHLDDIPYEKLRPILALDTASAVGRARRAYFLAAEAFRFDERNNPPMAANLRVEALGLLRGQGDAWYEPIEEQLKATRNRITQGRTRAETAYREMIDAHGRGDYRMALARCEELSTKYWWTDLYEARKTELEPRLRELRRLARSDLLRLRSGVPEGQFDFRPADGLTTIRYTGRTWYPDEGKVEPERLESTAREFWRDQLLEKEEWPEETWEREYGRAIRQTRDWFATGWSEQPAATRLVAGDGFYGLAIPLEDVLAKYGMESLADYAFNLDILVARHNRERDARTRALADEPLRVLYLQNHFDPRRPWSIEATVTWPEREQLTLFVLSAGRIQGLIAYGRPLYRGARGIALFDDAELENALQTRLSPFHAHLLEEGKRRETLTPSKGRSYLDSFADGVPYRLRLERTRTGVRFRGAPLSIREKVASFDELDSEKEPLVFDVSLRVPSYQFDKVLELPVHGRVFRFYGRIQPRISDVVVTGYQPEAGPE